MILILTRRDDPVAARLLKLWKDMPARLLTCEDLSVAGWQFRPGDIQHSRAVVSGRIVPAGKIQGVLVRLPCVMAEDLPHIVPGDRSYVAAEMTAFLAAWLNELSCPVLNRPTPTCLWGPRWSPEQWTHTAAQLGMDVVPRPLGRKSNCFEPASSVIEPAVQVTVVGGQSFGAVPRAMSEAALRLADAAQVELLGVHFAGQSPQVRFAGATLCPELHTQEEANAVLDHLCAKRAPQMALSA